MNEKEKALVAELKALLEKHGAKLVAHTDYDMEDNVCGCIVNIEGDGICIGVEMLAD